jgi:HSP20 family molecular chaperone IbpA
MPSTITRWDPFADLMPFRREMERLLAPLADMPESNLPRRWAPTADVIESGDQIVITAELPGVKDEDVEITVHDGVLRIAGERRLEGRSRTSTPTGSSGPTAASSAASRCRPACGSRTSPPASPTGS